MIDNVVYKLQGDGRDSWIVTYEDPDRIKDLYFSFHAENWKIKAILNEDGLLTQVETAINNLPEPPRITALLAWENGSIISSDSPTTDLIQSELGLTQDEMVDVFVRAINFKI